MKILKAVNTILFTLLIAFLPFQLGKHFFLPFSYVNGIRVDLLSPTVYLLDIVVLLLAVINIKEVIKFFTKKISVLFYILLVVNILLAKSPILSVYGAVRLFEFLTIFALGKLLLKNISVIKVTTIFMWTGILELGLGLSQMILRKAIQGPFYFIGERLFDINTLGIAKASLNGIDFLRPYGSFSHPNSLAGFYLLLYFFVLTNKNINKHIYLKFIALFVFSILVFISFSKIAILTYLVLNIFYLLKNKASCKICNISKVATSFVLSAIFMFAQTDLLTVDKRIELAKNSLSIIGKSPLFGVGIYNYLVAQSTFTSKYFLFFNQPVHNIFLLFVAEFGLLMTAFLIFKLVTKFNFKKITEAQLIIVLAIAMTGFFDHYWFTLMQNFFLLAVILVISFQDRSLSGR